MMSFTFMHVQPFALSTAAATLGLVGLANVDLSYSGEPILGGAYQVSLEEDYKANFPLRTLSRDIWNAVQIAVFNQSDTDVIHQPNGWLFTAEEFIEPKEQYEFANELDRVLNVLGSKTALVPVIVPDKARVYSDHLPHARTARITTRYTDTLHHLSDVGLPALNIAAVLKDARSEGPVFLKTDTHWSPFGAARVARHIANTTQVSFADPVTFATTWPDSVPFHGDLTTFIETGVFSNWVGPEPELISIPETVSQNDDMSLFGDVEIPVTLVGTSFSANQTFNFEGFLKEYLQADVLNAAQIGKGPFAPMRDYLASDEFLKSPPTLLIWEIPERYISTKDFDR